MGYTDVEANRALLLAHSGNVESVLRELSRNR